MDNTERIQGVLGAGNVTEMTDRYDAWAAKYEEDMSQAGYRTPTAVCGVFARLVPPGDGPVLDAGAGTGLGGEFLSILGYRHVVGFDASAEMLAVAEAKNVYADLRQRTLGEPLDFEDDTFTGVAAIGVFLPGHAPPDGLDELVRVTQPGGHVVYSMAAHAYDEGPFREKHDALVKAGKWEEVTVTPAFRSVPRGVDAFQSRVIAFRVL